MQWLPPIANWTTAAWLLFGATYSACGAANTTRPLQTYVVSPAGSDSQSGTSEMPWRTLTHAIAQVQPGDTVLVRAGEYPAGAAVGRCGEEGRPIVVRNFPGERPIING